MHNIVKVWGSSPWASLALHVARIGLMEVTSINILRCLMYWFSRYGTNMSSMC